MKHKLAIKTTLRCLRSSSLALVAAASFSYLSTHAQTAPTPAAPAPIADDEVILLDPFIVTEADNSGYTATSTLSGTRLKTELRDIGSAITVVTPEFMSDIGANNVSRLLPFVVSGEAGGIDGNFAGGNTNAGRISQAGSRENQQNSQRLRGIGAATNTRNLFQTDIGFDSYNISRVTVNRGPNSLLFGLSNPAGIIDYTLLRPNFSKRKTELSAAYGSNNSHRETLDHNEVLKQDRLAFRLAAKNSRDTYDQEPAYQDDKRLFLTAEAVLRKSSNTSFVGRTTLNVQYERGEADGIPVNVIPPTNGYSVFFSPPDPTLDSLPGIDLDPTILVGSPTFNWSPRLTVDNRSGTANIPQVNNFYYGNPYFVQIPLIFDSPNQVIPGYTTTNPALAGISGVQGRINYNASTLRPPVDAIATRSYYLNIPGFNTYSLQDRNVFDYRKRQLSGNSNHTESKFNVRNVTLSQELFQGRGGFEAAIDSQRRLSKRSLPFSFGENGAGNAQSDIYIDTSLYLSNFEPNPNVGRPFILQNGIDDQETDSHRDSLRFTTFYRFDFDKRGKTLFGMPVGNHVLTAFYSEDDSSTSNVGNQLSYRSATRTNLGSTTPAANSILGSASSPPVIIQYVGPSVLGAASESDVRITDVFSGRFPRAGDSVNNTFYDPISRTLITEPLQLERFLNSYSKSRLKVNSTTLSVKSDFFKSNLVTVFGWRDDKVASYASSPAVRDLTTNIINPASVALPSTPTSVEKQNPITYSAVAHLPEKYAQKLPLGMDLSLSYNYSENFTPSGVNQNLYGKIISPITGDTREYGILVEFLNRRLSLRVNRYETQQTNIRNNGGGATGAIYNLPTFLLLRYRAAETAGRTVASLPGATAAGFTTYPQIYNALINIHPEPTKTIRNIRQDAAGTFIGDPITGLTDTQDVEAKGLEVELIGNITPTWRVSFNVAQQKSTPTNSVNVTQEVVQYVANQLEQSGLLAMDQAPNIAVRQTIRQRLNTDVLAPLSATTLSDGALAQEQREWRANIVTSYDFRQFDSRWLKHFTVGTGVRWQSKAAIGNPLLTGERLRQRIVDDNPTLFANTAAIPVGSIFLESQYPDLENPIYGPDELTGDVFVTYKHKFRHFNYALQLNVNNAWGNSKDIPVTANPDGAIAVVRIPNETRWFLTSTFNF